MIQMGLVALFRAEMAQVLEDRIYANVLKETPLLAGAPAMTYGVVAGIQWPTFTTSGMQRLRLEVDFYGVNYLDSLAAFEAFDRFFNGYSGKLADGTYLQNAERISNMDTFDDVPKRYRVMAEYYLFFNAQT